MEQMIKKATSYIEMRGILDEDLIQELYLFCIEKYRQGDKIFIKDFEDKVKSYYEENDSDVILLYQLGDFVSHLNSTINDYFYNKEKECILHIIDTKLSHSERNILYLKIYKQLTNKDIVEILGSDMYNEISIQIIYNKIINKIKFYLN